MIITQAKRIVWLLSWTVFLSWPIRATAANSPPADKEAQEELPVRSYTVDKRVSDFPATPDLSTPEAAYATIMRHYMATGASGSEWTTVSIRKLSGTQRRPVSPERAQSCLDAHIQEVIICGSRLARVVAKVRAGNTVGYDQRSLFYVDSRWLNVGHDGLAPTLQEARDRFLGKSERLHRSALKELGEYWNRPPVADPNAHLEPYTEFLRKRGREPQVFVMDAFSKHRLVVMGEVHNRPAYWTFNAQLVRDPAFPETVASIYMELPSNHQGNIDRFLAQDTCEKELVIQMLRDFFELGWPCKPTLDFFLAVWEVNQGLSSDKKLRIRLVDMQRPWEKIQKREDWRIYRVNRDRFMAENVLDDLRTNKDERNGFFIVGMGHAMEDLRFDKKTPKRTSGWHLEQALGDQLCTVFQHAPVMTNKGVTSGRLALGLIDAVFAALDDRPIAFTLQEGPFGELPFDGMPDSNVYGTFRDGYDAYLYLKPLEDEVFSPLIEGFYAEAFMPELDRRYRLMNGRPLFADLDLPTPERVTQMRAAYWGQPRSWIPHLGPENAWHHGDGWSATLIRERHRSVTRKELTAELDRIYRGIKEIAPEKYSPRSWENTFGFDYLTMTNWPAMYQWWCDVIKKHPLVSAEYGPLGRNKDGLPQIEVTTTLQGDITFSKTFVFEWQARAQRWKTKYGLDLHLDPQWEDLPQRRQRLSP